MSYLSQLLSNETERAPKAVKPQPVTFVGHIPADALETTLEALINAVPADWTNDVQNVEASKHEITGKYTRYLMVKGPKGSGSNMTVFSTGSVTIVRPEAFEAAWGLIADLGIVEGKAPARKN